MNRVRQTEAELADNLSDEIRRGLSTSPKSLPAKCFYDDIGSRLFEEICKLDEYYLTRTEQSIFDKHLPEIAALMPKPMTLVELGSGSSRKTRQLLDQIPNIRRYVPVDIARDFLSEAALSIEESYPSLEVIPVCADFTKPFALPRAVYSGNESRVFFFPGSTIGNLTPSEAETLLRAISEMARPHGGLLIGVDLKKSKERIERAYNDESGITAAFNLNVLARINSEYGGSFDLQGFEHYAFYNENEGRIEMHLRSKNACVVFVENYAVNFEEGETIHTENSYKYSVREFQTLAARAGFKPRRVWVDSDELFSVHYLSA